MADPTPVAEGSYEWYRREVEQLRAERDALKAELAATREELEVQRAIAGQFDEVATEKAAELAEARAAIERVTAAATDALVVLTGDLIGNPVLPENRKVITDRLDAALDAPQRPEGTQEPGWLTYKNLMGTEPPPFPAVLESSEDTREETPNG